MTATWVRRAGTWLWRRDRAAVALIFCVSVVPLVMVVGLAVDASLYARALSQLNMAADTAAIQAVRAAAQGYQVQATTTSAATSLGNTAGQEWFQAQLGTLNNADVLAGNIKVNTTYTNSPSQFSAQVTYSGTTRNSFGSMFGVPTFNVAGAATATISNSYVEILLMLDNSPSMLIGSTSADIQRMEQATPCSTQAAFEGQSMTADYTWLYTSGVGYNYSGSPPDTPPPSSTVNGSCDIRYTGSKTACPYPPSLPNVSQSNTWYCKNGGGLPVTTKGTTHYYVTSPCGFACHDRSDNQDFLGLARSLSPPVTLRLDVVRNAAINVINTLNSRQAFAGQFSVGVWQFSNGDSRYGGIGEVYPSSGEAGSDFSTAVSDVQNTVNTQPITTNAQQTNFPSSISYLNQNVTGSGDGGTPSHPVKNLFIVTDGMENYTSLGPMTNANNETYCKQFWDMGFSVYVLYTPYLPLPHKQYLSSIMQYAEPPPGSPAGTDSPDVAALKACARTPANFFVASDPSAINAAMQSMLAAALNSPGRLVQ